MLAEGVHFSSEIDPFSLGRSFGGKPLRLSCNGRSSFWIYSWIRFECIKFVMVTCLLEGLFEVSRNYKCELLSGDTIKNKSNYNFFSITAIGYLEG